MNDDKNLQFDYRYGFSMPENYVFKARKGLDEEIVKEISFLKKEPIWMTKFRLQAYQAFKKRSLPLWGADLSSINFDDIYYYIKPLKDQKKSWQDLPKEIKETYDKIGVPEAEKKFLAGVSAQYESEVVYKNIQKELARQGVIFVDMDTGLRDYPEIVKKYFGTVVSLYDNKFASLNSAVWSGGSFVYVPSGVKVSLPLQAYFRINAQNFGQFERTLIIAEEGSYVHYLEGCLPAGQMILTSEGYKNIEAIKPGDFVYTSSGYLSKVKSTMTRNYFDYLYEVIPLSPENKFYLTKEHPVLAIKRKKVLVKRKKRFNWLEEVNTEKLIQTKPEYIEIENLEKGDFIIFPKIKDQIIEKKDIFSDELMELFGFYLAEGSAFYHQKLKQYIVSFSFSKKEKENYCRVIELIEKITEKKPNLFIDDKKNEAKISIYSKYLFDILIKNCGKYSSEKFISQEIIFQKKEKLEKLFWSYFKGDGNLSIKNKTSHLYRINTASKNLAFSIQLILNKIGIFASIGFRKGGKDKILNREIKRKNQYIIRFTMPKKWSEVRETGNYYIVPIKSLKKKKVEIPVFNIEVDGNNSYLVKGFAVHNCTAPIYTTDSLHSAVVEIIVKKGARVRYTTVQNWSKNVYNLVTKRAKVEEEATMEWIDCNLGSKITMKYPSCILTGRKAKGEVLSIAYASENQLQDAGAKMIHLASETSSRIVSKSIAGRGGRTSYRGLVHVSPNASKSSSYVSCDALILDEDSRSDTYPTMKIENKKTHIQHEATVEKIGEEKLFYLQSRGIKKSDAEGLLVNGFIEPVAKEIPLEYTIELNRLINLEMSGSVG
ncbi:MAG: Fe-S cluster assembly protein SufB [Patescibacteria group bacterium]|nr:Fe-S cluster assembly protein SufB [Patescibacteria group bacterium]